MSLRVNNDHFRALKPSDLSEIFQKVDVAVDEAIVRFSEEENWGNRTGGYFCLADRETGRPIFLSLVGVVATEKMEKYLRLAQEKARRLSQVSRAETFHLSSWESRELSKERYGGAIVAGDLIFSFSGLPELGDEVVMLNAAMACRKLDVETARKIANRSANPYTYFTSRLSK